MDIGLLKRQASTSQQKYFRNIRNTRGRSFYKRGIKLINNVLKHNIRRIFHKNTFIGVLTSSTK